MPIARRHAFRLALILSAALAAGTPVLAQDRSSGRDNVPVDAGSFIVLESLGGDDGPASVAPVNPSAEPITAPLLDIHLRLVRRGEGVVVSGSVPETADLSVLADMDVSGLDTGAADSARFATDLAYASELVTLLSEGRVSLRASILTLEGAVADPALAAQLEALLAAPPAGLVIAMARIDRPAIEVAEDAGLAQSESQAEPPTVEPAEPVEIVEPVELAQAAEVIAVTEPDAPEPSPACHEILAEFSARNSILFNSGASTITPASAEALTELVADIAACGDVPIYIEGHTDSDGPAEANLVLSVSRAEAVVAALVQLGVDPSRLYAIGYGEADPIADNATAEGKRQNRRIVVLAEDRFGLADD